ncbi:hypothetical protein BBF96_12670 [Anoxybacter fermentans]|uniref:PKD/Chitinase domain-containing protein n=1 Tax=Anoxybacter fermentans TaxID=1323375 RepID=A0A3Q9HRQ7_9FIRM|nr:PKD domain-containing protein [Anoxybacter fermentans]AZR74173.1 hypothetical protein BBF96_12670 [Anoxybacter fermentans]
MKKLLTLLTILILTVGLVGCDFLPFMNKAPVIYSLISEKTTIHPGEEVKIQVKASDPNGDSLVYTWNATGGKINGTGSEVIWVAPQEIGEYTITVKVSDSKVDVSKSIQISVQPLPNEAPVISSLTVEKSVVQPEEKVKVQVQASDPDGDVLTYTWTVTGGSIEGTGSEVFWIASQTDGNYTITVEVSDGRDTVTGSINIQVNTAPIIEEISASSSSVLVNGTLTLTAIVNDPTGDNLTYRWEDAIGEVLGTEPSLEWHAPDTYGVYPVTLYVSDGIFESSKTININVEDDSHHAPEIQEVAITTPYFESQVVVDSVLAAGRLYAVWPIFVDVDESDQLDIQATADVGEVEIFASEYETICFWVAPDVAGEYTLTFTVTDGIYTVVKEYPVQVVENSCPEIDAIYINNELITDNYYQAAPGEEITISVLASDSDNDAPLEYKIIDPYYEIWNTNELTFTAPMEEEMDEIWIYVFDGLQVRVASVIIDVDNGADNNTNDQNAIDQNAIDQINNLISRFVNDYENQDINSILSYTDSSYQAELKSRLNRYFELERVSNLTIRKLSEIIEVDGEFEVQVAVQGDFYVLFETFPNSLIRVFTFWFTYDEYGNILISSVWL